MDELRHLIRSVSPDGLRHQRYWVLIGAFAASIVLPAAPNPVSHFILALSLVAIYEMLIWLLVLSHRRRAAATPAKPTPGQQRLPMAIAVPNRARPKPSPRRAPSLEPVRRNCPATIDLRKH